MHLPLRSYAFLVTALLGTTFGTGQVWNLALGLRAGAAGTWGVVAGGLGLALVVVSGAVLGRFLYVLGPWARPTQGQRQVVCQETYHEEEDHVSG